MILPDLVLPSRINQHWQYSGIDSPSKCLDKKHFADYPYCIDYVYNSRGLRDREWPHDLCDLKQAIWCVGDSFTVGLGQPLHHTWPQILQAEAGRRTINVSMDGASNQWILRRALDILRAVRPTHLVVMWSYTHRRESSDTNLTDEDRRENMSRDCNKQDFQHWLNLQAQLVGHGSNIVQLAIPQFAGYTQAAPVELNRLWYDIKDQGWPQCPKSLQDLLDLPAAIKHELQSLHRCWQSFYEILAESQIKDENLSVCVLDDGSLSILPQDVIYIHERLDWARDHHHFDIKTARWVVENILDQMTI